MNNLTPKTATHFLAIERLKALFNDNSECKEIDIEYFLKDEEFSNFDDIRDILDNNDALDREIIYYASAMTYLSENDNSLRESLEIASEMGFEVSKLNSEILASLLASRNLQDEFNGLEIEINEILEECLEMQEADEQEAQENETNNN
jgi:hypothetical protein